jgi:NUMOD4 motif/HNH endonuclease
VQELLPFPEPERWLPVRGWEGLYEVSDLGRVRSLRRKGGNNRWYGGKVLVPYLHKGYPVVPLCRGGTRTMAQVHRLVLEGFTGPCPPGMMACHANGNPGDPGAANLRWDTAAGNMRDQYRHGTRARGMRHGHAKLDDEAVTEIRRRYAAGVAGTGPPVTHRQLARVYGVVPSHVTNIINHRARAA